MAGLSFQRGSSMSGASTTIAFSPMAFLMSRTAAAFIPRPSTATITLSYSEKCPESHSGISTCPGTLVLCSSTPEPGSWREAWMKYLVSVQTPAWSSVITRSPSPVKPDTQEAWSHRGAEYSLLCGSLPVRTTASQPFERIIARTASTLSLNIFMERLF